MGISLLCSALVERGSERPEGPARHACGSGRRHCGPPFARGGSNLLFGFSDDGPKWSGVAASEPAGKVGAGAFLVTLHLVPGKTNLSVQDTTDLSIAVSGLSGLRLVLAVYGSPTSAPQDEPARTQFCTFAKNAVARFPSINGIVIWNEPNVSSF
jgi:hypothetical protein